MREAEACALQDTKMSFSLRQECTSCWQFLLCGIFLTNIFLKEIKGINEKCKTKDLPNYAQHAVPIFFLSQEWLWCESCCGNATKYEEKTIDLCKNPITKEPKLLMNVLSFCFLSMATRLLSQLMILQSSISAFCQQPDLDF